MQDDYQQKLLERLQTVQKISLREAMEYLAVSESTARRIFTRMEQDGMAIRTHGGLQSHTSLLNGYSFDRGIRTNIGKKRAIAAEAVHLVEDGDVLFCDSGTTVRCFCAALADRIRGGDLSVKLYTNSIANLEILADVLPVMLLGGVYRPNRKDVCGYLANNMMMNLHFTKAFLGADGCVDGKGFATTDMETASIDQIAISNSDRAVILADSTKFSSTSHLIFAPVKSLYAVITDEDITQRQLEELRRINRNIIIASCR